jgi:hypothetical protein
MALVPAAPTSKGCEDCLALGAEWTELRVCLTCGHVGCCEDSEHAHALQHFNATGHPVIAPLARSETWGWCYVHRRYFDPMPSVPSKRGSALTAFFSRFGKAGAK